MALSTKQKHFIDSQRNKLSAKEIAEKSNQPEALVQSYLDETRKPELSSDKSRLFTILALSIPILFFVFLEVGLRLGNYKGDLSLFIYPDDLNGEYVFPNPDYAKRYFFNTTVIPNPARDAFLRKKPENGFRVFALGGSSAVGYPYGFNIKFTKYVELALKDVMPDKTVEVVNLGTSAVNSYTLYDQVDEVLEHKPDAILIYAGHNEFYGALGVASSESLGAFPAFVRMYLKIQRLKTFLLLRDMITWVMTTVQGSPKKSGTLMERVVREQEIPLDSDLYNLGKIQFQSNMKAIIGKFKEHGIPVYLSSLASNLKDQAPFVSVKTDLHPSAEDVYQQAIIAYESGNLIQALVLFEQARDLDALRFRATSEFNTLIKLMANETGSVYVPGEEAFKSATKDGIIGNELMLEHLHPNVDGYSVLGKAFVETLIKSTPKGITLQTDRLKDWSFYQQKMYASDFDTTLGNIKILKLKAGWPFVKASESSPNINYKPKDLADSLALDVSNGKLQWEPAKVKLAQAYVERKQYDKALTEYLGIAVDMPYSASPFVFASQLLIEQNKLQEAEPLLERANQLEANAFVKKMLGAIKINSKNYEVGIRLLKESVRLNASDPQAWYNLSGGYALNQQFKEAKDAASKVRELNPNFPGLQAWMRQLEQIK